MGQVGAIVPWLMSVAMWRSSHCCNMAYQNLSKTDPPCVDVVEGIRVAWPSCSAQETQHRRGGGDGDRGVAE